MKMDSIRKSWLSRQLEEGMRLAAASDVFTLHPGPGSPPQEYLARFDCPTMVEMQGAITPHTGFEVLIRFPLDYLRSVPNPAAVVALLSPQNAYHPNVAPPFICVGDIAPGTSLCELVFQIFEIMTFNKLRLDDFLNEDACSWARNHMDLFPLTTQSLRRREISLDISEIDITEIASEPAP
jgi:hypothetical protein